MKVEEIKAGLPFRTVLFGRVYFLIIFNRLIHVYLNILRRKLQRPTLLQTGDSRMNGAHRPPEQHIRILKKQGSRVNSHQNNIGTVQIAMLHPGCAIICTGAEFRLNNNI